jgi:hypothetical protein
MLRELGRNRWEAKVLNMKLSHTILFAAGLALLSSQGCKPREVEAHTPVRDLVGPLEKEYAAKEGELPLAGRKIEPPVKIYTKEELIAHSGLTFGARHNPFALFAEESAFQSNVRLGIILSKMPGYANVLPPPSEPPPPELNVPEAQPYRRASGIYFGDSVSAIIEMGDNKTYIVSPGQRVGDTEWYVESIDAEKVILYRESRRDPRRIVIRLETPPIGGG